MLEQMPLILAQDDGLPAPPAGPQNAQDGGQPTGQPGAQPGAEGQTGEVQDGGAQTNQPPPGNQDGFGSSLPSILMIVLLVVMVVVMTTGQRREKKKRQSMLAALKKGDKVQTVGGIIGTIVDIREDEIVLKVDETANTRLRFNRSAIQGVLQEQQGEE